MGTYVTTHEKYLCFDFNTMKERKMWMTTSQFKFCYSLPFMRSPEPKAHWWAYSIGRHLSSVNIFNHLLLRSHWATWNQIYVEPLWVEETKVPSNDHGHLTQMAAMPRYGKKKTLKIFFCKTELPMIMKLCLQHRVLQYYQSPSNDDPMLTFDLFTLWSILVTHLFVWENA